jgi:antitoxin component YwqK of YwqJK toxin-antitoxin module
MQILFVITIITTITLIYINSKNKAKDGNVSHFFPQLNGLQERVDKYPNGKIIAIGNVKGYNKEGKWAYYNQAGKLEFIEIYENGILVSTEKPANKE